MSNIMESQCPLTYFTNTQKFYLLSWTTKVTGSDQQTSALHNTLSTRDYSLEPLEARCIKDNFVICISILSSFPKYYARSRADNRKYPPGDVEGDKVPPKAALHYTHVTMCKATFERLSIFSSLSSPAAPLFANM